MISLALFLLDINIIPHAVPQTYIKWEQTTLIRQNDQSGDPDTKENNFLKNNYK